MKLVWITTILIIALVLVVPAILGLGIRKIPSGSQQPLTDTQILFSGVTISQSFTAKQDQLSAIAMTVKNPYFRNKNDLQFLILDPDGISRMITINGTNIPDGDYLYFNFPPFPSSAGKTFTFILTSPQTNPTESLEFYHSDQAFAGTYQVNGLIKGGSLSFVSYYSPQNILGVWNMIYGGWLSKLLADLPFAIFYGILIFGAIIYLSLNRKRFN